MSDHADGFEWAEDEDADDDDEDMDDFSANDFEADEEENEDGKSDGMSAGSGDEDESEEEGKSTGNPGDDSGEEDSKIISQMEGPGAGVGSPSDEPYIPHSTTDENFRSRESELVTTDESASIFYVNLPVANLDNIIIDHKENQNIK